MSLIKCSICEKMISPNAKSCPNCGEPINNSKNNENKFNVVLENMGLVYTFEKINIIKNVSKITQSKYTDCEKLLNDLPCIILKNIDYLTAQEVKLSLEQLKVKIRIVESNKKTDYINKEKDIFYQFDGRYLGGFSDLEGNKNVIIQIKQNSLYLIIKNKIKVIPSNQIKSVKIMSQQQITNGVNLGSLLVLGVFAFALPNKTKVQNYLVITYEDDDKERSIIIEVYSRLEERVRDMKTNLRLV